jgi:hypothetical protein
MVRPSFLLPPSPSPSLSLSLSILGLPSLPSSIPSTQVIGKSEGDATDHHGHVTALTVAPEFRRLSLASSLMSLLETSSASPTHAGYFVDLFVRCNNSTAIAMYEGMGYSVFRRVVGYYAGMGGAGSEGRDGKDAFGTFHVYSALRSGEAFCSGSGRGVLEADRAAFVFAGVFGTTDMRKPLPRDKKRQSIRPNGREVLCTPADVWW